jgi:hypothetical protein
VADLCVSLLQLPAGTGLTFEVKSTIPFSQPWEGISQEAAQQGGGRDWAQELSGLKRGVTGKTVNGVYSGRKVEAAVAGSSEAAAAAVAAGGSQR